MGLKFEELTTNVRSAMLQGFEAEESGALPFRSSSLSPAGLDAWPEVMRHAITDGTDDGLIATLMRPEFWNSEESYVRAGVMHYRRVNLRQASERLGTSEFNTWYVHGIASVLKREGVNQCEVYRAAEPKGHAAACCQYEDRRVTVDEVLAGHRARYWPTPNVEAFSIPAQPGCHHTLRRLRDI